MSTDISSYAQLDEKTTHTPLLDVGFVCMNVLIQYSSAVEKVSLSYPHLMHVGLVSKASSKQLLCMCTSFHLCEIKPEAFSYELTDVL